MNRDDHTENPILLKLPRKAELTEATRAPYCSQPEIVTSKGYLPRH